MLNANNYPASSPTPIDRAINDIEHGKYLNGTNLFMTTPNQDIEPNSGLKLYSSLSKTVFSRFLPGTMFAKHSIEDVKLKAEALLGIITLEVIINKENTSEAMNLTNTKMLLNLLSKNSAQQIGLFLDAQPIDKKHLYCTFLSDFLSGLNTTEQFSCKIIYNFEEKRRLIIERLLKTHVEFTATPLSS